jgi:deoxyribodipyrimidine photolyase-related protein
LVDSEATPDRHENGGEVDLFRHELDDRQPDPSGRRWLFVPHDQLTDQLGPLADEDPAELGVIVVENAHRASLRPYHRQKLALLLTNLRHFALEQAGRGVAVRHVVAEGRYRNALEPLAAELGEVRVMRPAEYELRADLAPLADRGLLHEIPHEGWLTTTEDFIVSQKPEPPWRMDAFYRHVRKRTGILMEDGRPVGGKLSFDADNRQPWRGEPPAPSPPSFSPDAVTKEVAELIEEDFSRHPGQLDLSSLPATREDAELLWRWARDHCLHDFGPYEDAMSVASSGLFHTRISPLLNIHRLLPARVLDDVLDMDLPLASKEGFVRQVLGWREFVRHVHERTDGFRVVPGGAPEIRTQPGDGGWSGWSGEEWRADHGAEDLDGGAAPNHLGAANHLPPAFWGTPSGLACLDRVVDDVWREGWSHHITRLMVLSNIATLLGVSPRELTDWFWVAYIDAFDWVVEPNVLAMGSFATGPLMTTKPYVSGAAYIDRMSDYCAACAFDPKKNCPITNLYWVFLERNRDVLADNPRMRVVISSSRKRPDGKKSHDRSVHQWVRSTLEQGQKLDPEDRPAR